MRIWRSITLVLLAVSAAIVAASPIDASTIIRFEPRSNPAAVAVHSSFIPASSNLVLLAGEIDVSAGKDSKAPKATATRTPVTVVNTATPLPNTATPVSAAPTQIPNASGSSNLLMGVYRPEYPNNLSSVVAYETAVNKRMAIIHWYAGWLPGSWKRDFSRSDLDIVANRESIPMISWGPEGGSLRETVLSGANDAYIESWAQGLAAYGKPVLLRWSWEMTNQPMYDWAIGVNGNTPEDYVLAWKYVRSIFVSNGATNVQWVWCPNQTRNAVDPIYRAVYPGDDQVEWLSLDVYNTGTAFDWGLPRWASFAEIIGPSYQNITSVSSKPIILGEIGSTENGGDKGAWIADALGPNLQATFPKIAGIIWFDINKEQPWHLQSSTGAYNAFLNAWKLPQYPTTISGLSPR